MKTFHLIICSFFFASLALADEHNSLDEHAEAAAKQAEHARSLIEVASRPAPAVLRETFTTGIENREPVDTLLDLDTSFTKVYFFTELTNLKGRRVTHRWTYMDKVMAEVEFNIGSNRWRVNSSKNLLPEWQGSWQVDVLDDLGNLIDSRRFHYGPLEVQ